ncbi:hypothetical protein GXW82_11930 [Streptacidiphilus sp. 4-A2]|nr:hypothetical protein [Streptacidiphilus sp. 4-A2]
MALIQLSQQGAWIVSAAGAALVVLAAWWAAGRKLALAFIPVTLVMFALIVGTSLLRGRPIGTPSLFFADAMIVGALFLAMLKRLLENPDFIQAGEDEKRDMGAAFVRKAGFVSIGVLAALLLVEFLA